MKCIKDKIDQGLNKSVETLQDQLNESTLLKRLEDTALHKHYTINQKKKDCQPHKC